MRLIQQLAAISGRPVDFVELAPASMGDAFDGLVRADLIDLSLLIAPFAS